MWFKNLCLYRFQQPFELTPEELEQALEKHAFSPCERSDMASHGWISPLGREGQQLVHAGNGFVMLCLQEESKLLPASVIREAVSEKVAEIEQREARKVRKREKENLRDEVTLDLLPRAFSRTRQIFGYIDTRDGWLVVDAASWKQAENFAESLREAIGTLPIAPPNPQHAPQAELTDWVANERLPADVELGEEAVLEDPQTEGCEVRCKRQDLLADEMKAHLKSGKRIRRLAVTWRDRLGCVLDSDISVKRLRFLDVVQEESSDRNPETAEERFDSDFAVMTLELRGFIKRLMELYGGEAEQPAAQPEATA